MKAAKPRDYSERDRIACLIREVGKIVDRVYARQATELVDGRPEPPSEASPNRVEEVQVEPAVAIDPQALDYAQLYRAGPGERVELLRRGIPAWWVAVLASSMGVPVKHAAAALNLAPGAIIRKLRKHAALSTEEGVRVLALARLVGQAQVAVEESGNSEGFNAAQWVARWIDEPLVALGGRTPASLMGTPDGQALVFELIARMQSGSYS
jgi:putative toxin-antitoxin system antitoxin component (TIGR02293 family)